VRARVCKQWQDAQVVTIYKGKGSPTDPKNYRGIFLLDVAGKVLAAVLNERISKAAETWLDDNQNGFRPRRSTAHSIHLLRRAQEACRRADYKSLAVFIDFQKAFDSPPRGALLECLQYIGLPPDVVAMVAAIHENPEGRVAGTAAWFKVARGVRQGCVLGPTLFIVLLDFCLKRKQL
jgi:Reverse transcriptase (RNA-dependent DNA polymerase)